MAYNDKLCGVCDEYVELSEDGKRFHITGVNVCKKCVDTKALTSYAYSDFELHKRYDEGRNITRGSTLFVDPDTGKFWRCRYKMLRKEDAHLCFKKLKFSKPKPWLYEVVGGGIKHQGLLTCGGLNSSDVRKIRKVLRKLGVKGDIKRLVK